MKIRPNSTIALCAFVVASGFVVSDVSEARGLRGAFNAASGARAAGAVSSPATRMATARAAPTVSASGRGSITTTAPTLSASRAAAHGQGSYARTWGATSSGGTRFGATTIRSRVSRSAYRNGLGSTAQVARAGSKTRSSLGGARRAPVPVSPRALAAKRAAAPTKGALKNAFSHAKQAKDRMHITYLGIDRKTGKPYVGYASKPGASTVNEVLKYRYGKQYKRFGGKAPRVIAHGYGAQGKARTRGTEQLVYERYQRRAIGTANRRRPVGQGNKRADIYRRQGNEVIDALRRHGVQ